MSKRKVLLLAGGTSGEHEISLISCKHILEALDRTRYQPILVVIQKDGVMTLVPEADLLKIPRNPKLIQPLKGKPVTLQPYSLSGDCPKIFAGNESFEFDLAFPILHGPGGEDGSIQGLFEFAGVPVVGCDVKASALCMDKGMTKRLCVQAGLPVAPFIELHRAESWRTYSRKDFPAFVKPASLGSSLGVIKVKTSAELLPALEEAFRYDTKVLVEDAIDAREIEVAILGKRGDLLVSPAGEIKVRTEFYSYDAKYVLEDAAELLFPAPLDAAQMKEVQSIAEKVFLSLECFGMARLDFFLCRKTGKFMLNEVNTIPGFTPISMYPKLIQLTGLKYEELVSRLIELAWERKTSNK